MRELTWRWTLPSGESLRATVDHRRDIESVWLGPRLASRSRIGQKPEGHVVGLTRARAGPYRSGCPDAFHEARIVFEPHGDRPPPTCALWLGNVPLIPDLAPRADSRESTRVAIFAVAVGAVLAAMGWAL